MTEPQTYANHRHQARLWMSTALIGIAAFSMILLFALRAVSVISVALVLLSIAVLCTLWMVRQYALKLQNRIILLEMRIRLAALGREHDMARLTMRQIIALRFASDAELAALAERALSENLTPDQIKRAVTNWQADTMRT